MFKKLAGFRFFESRHVVSLEPRRFAPGKRPAMHSRARHSQAVHSQAVHSNDNLPGFRRKAVQRRRPKPALACRWYSIEGRLECRWQAEVGDTMPSEDLDRRHPSEPPRSAARAAGWPRDN
jgi:hypothetical protein